ncbi:transcriptional regulator with XRE-family HTH domain [Rhizobium mesoamericanum]|uniref:helix-turn-helix domain-containing protein n=1 Tax=Rhizobium mesoamericanum TaxID=1079800 RepID=UPI00278BA9C7|nr:helix-turn-helix transcriptional regulator [Rhizobium mesoamericanum]MDQ0559130.1 transcriptional regulator with XRE-family HTH domain [Rhizobium mesoamericanum]
MNSTTFNFLGQQLLAARRRRGLNQSDLATRVGRNRARISELERDLAANRLGRDRLTLFVELCDALDLVPLLVPKSRVAELRPFIEHDRPPRQAAKPSSAFDDVFIDLDDSESEER